MNKIMLLLFLLLFLSPQITFAQSLSGYGSSKEKESRRYPNQKLKEDTSEALKAIYNLLNSSGSENNNNTNNDITNPPYNNDPNPSGPYTPIDPNTTGINNIFPYNPQYHDRYKGTVSVCLTNRAIYEEASRRTGVPWLILAGIHYREGGCATHKSCVSGRVIGEHEPDVGNKCIGNSGLGKAKPLKNGGCGFTSLLDSCIYGGDHLKSKIGKNPETVKEYAKALSYYNGGGNSNCLGGTPYTSCPVSYQGRDDPYVYNKFDAQSQNMYLRYCADRTLCNPPRPFSGLGVGTVVAALIGQL